MHVTFNDPVLKNKLLLREPALKAKTSYECLKELFIDCFYFFVVDFYHK